MNFLVVSSAPIFIKNNIKESYLPFVNEMDIWFKYSEKVRVIAPDNYPDKVLTKKFYRDDIYLYKIPLLDFRNYKSIFSSIFKFPLIIFQMFRAYLWADHIHLRCPGNVGLLGLFMAIFFPLKPKSVKYAGNWDPSSKQPLSYKFQKWLLNNHTLIKNKKVLVYGKWSNQPEYIKSFFTASFSEKERVNNLKGRMEPVRFIFCGSLVSGKNPLLAIEIVTHLHKKGYKIILDFYGDGPEKHNLETYINRYELKGQIKLHGNVNQKFLVEAYKKSHFCILPSESEGWPKAIAEGMFFGCVPIATKVSCVPWMLGEGKRGILVDDKNQVVQKVEKLIQNIDIYNTMSEKARRWSQQYTLEKFEKAIVKFL
jgi:glycosyltransferase involved in cell wall biosynthesis